MKEEIKCIVLGEGELLGFGGSLGMGGMEGEVSVVGCVKMGGKGVWEVMKWKEVDA